MFNPTDTSSPNPEEVLLIKEASQKISPSQEKIEKCKHFLSSPSYHKSKKRRNQDLSIFWGKTEGLTEKEIEKKTGIPKSTIRKRWKSIKSNIFRSLGISLSLHFKQNVYAKKLLSLTCWIVSKKTWLIAATISIVSPLTILSILQSSTLTSNNASKKQTQKIHPIKQLSSAHEPKKPNSILTPQRRKKAVKKENTLNSRIQELNSHTKDIFGERPVEPTTDSKRILFEFLSKKKTKEFK